MVVLHNFRSTLFFFAKSNSPHTLVDLIFLFILSIHVTFILSYPSFHDHDLTSVIFLSKALVILMTSYRNIGATISLGAEGVLPRG